MLTVRSILCPVDFSEQSRTALAWAAAIAAQRGAELIVVHAIEPLLAQVTIGRLGERLSRVEAGVALREFVAATLPEDGRPGPRLHLQVTEGSPPATILGVARRRSTGLIVMGTHGLGGIRKLLLGSTTEQVLAATRWPVLAVPRRPLGPPANGCPGLGEKAILLAAGLREHDGPAVQWAADLARERGLRLVLAHVVEPVAIPRQQAQAVEFEGNRIAFGQQRLARLASRLRALNSGCVVSVGPPAETIAALALEHAAGLVVMGHTGRVGPAPHHPGALAYRILRVAHVPVLVVPTPANRTSATSVPVTLPVRGGADATSDVRGFVGGIR
jgi:nucleotide-binding universal stress UspA family protein